MELILAVRISQSDLAVYYLVLTGRSVAAGVVGALDLGGVTEISSPARVTDTSEAASLQYRDEI